MLKNNKILLLIIVLISIAFPSNAERHITLRINNAYGPFEYLNKDGKPIGFTVDVFNAINNINHFDYTIKSNKEIFNFYSTVIDSTELVTSMDSVPLNSPFITSEPYGYIDNDLITRIYSNINHWEDMNGKNVLIVKDSPLIAQFDKHKVKANFVFIKNVPDGLRLLSSGKYDAMISSNDAAYFYINKLELTNLSVKPLFCQPLAIRFIMLDSPENRKIIKKINGSLQAIRANGTYDAIYSKRFFPTNEESLKTFELWIIIIGVTIMMVLIIYVLYIHWLYQAEKRKKSVPVQDSTPLVINLSKIYDSLPTATVYFDILGQIKFINQAGKDLTNIAKKSKLMTSGHSLFDHTILDAEMIDNLKINKAVHFTYNLINNDNEFNYLGDYALPKKHIFNIFIMPIANYGTPLNGYIAYIYDTTAKHQTEYANLKYATSLSQISDNKLLDICYYDSAEDLFYTFTQSTAKSTDISYEKCLSYIHPLYRSQFIEEFLSILNGEKRSAKITVKKLNTKNQKYSTCDVTLNAIKVDSNTTIGISLVSTTSDIHQTAATKNKELLNHLTFLSKSSGYQFLEYTQETELLHVTRNDNSHKTYNIMQIQEAIHHDDYEKVLEIMNDLRSQQTNNAYLFIRFKADNSKQYNYYDVNLHSCHEDTPPSDKIIGVYHDISENMLRLRELEEFKESTTLACEMNNMGYFEYNVNEFEHSYIPFMFTIKYGIDDDNFIDCMDDESRDTFNGLIDLFNERRSDIGTKTVRISSPETKQWVNLEFILIPIRDDINQEVYKYMGFLKEIPQNAVQ